MPTKKKSTTLTSPQRPADGFDADDSNDVAVEEIAPSASSMATAGEIGARPVDPRDVVPERDDVSAPPPAFTTSPVARARRAPPVPPPANPARPMITGRDEHSRAGDAAVAAAFASGAKYPNEYGAQQNARAQAHVDATVRPIVTAIVDRAFNSGGGRRQ